MKQSILFVIFVFITLHLFSQEKAFFENPVIHGDMADPSVIRVGDTYYTVATSSEWAPIYPVFTSKDLINWEQKGHIFEEKPGWTSQSFWAPEFYYHNGRMFCYYTGRRKSDNISYIGVASAEGTSLRFQDHGPIIELGTEAIDAFIFDDNGQLYISWKAYGLDQRPIELLGSRLSDDGLRLEGEPFSLLKDDEGIGMEGQHHFKHGDYYYIIYSAKSCCGPSSDYDVRVARSRSFKGPYEKYDKNPILSGGGGDYISVGHGTLVDTPDGRYFYLSHGYQSGAAFFMGRQPVLHELVMTDDGWVRFTTGNKAVNRQPVPFEGTVQKKQGDFRDDFSGKILKVEWTWNYPFSDIDVSLKKRELVLTGNPKADNDYGTVLCLRPQASRYSYQTKVSNVNKSFKGLTMYGDDKNLVTIGIKDDRIEMKSVREGTESVLFETVMAKGKPHFKIDVEGGCFLTFSYSRDGKSWTTVNETPLDMAFLVRWDRVARPGLIHIGEYGAPARFDSFVMKNERK
ncbi:family 43 glycosylhydrolase [Proteiniphilum sp.]|uniref:family 43 glycosylhydrolase n=1 Tax=Proteiniphilum sp. TaxID=1926877 RepID=UPI002B1F1C7E|nr:family 43 glycosylhydrolase [Proteiniphilum sp.]MEA4916004.1 family 43 glycosylhydrolase [Proteiniphilum sp.]